MLKNYDYITMETVHISIEKGHQDPKLSLKYILNEVEEIDALSSKMKNNCARLHSIEKVYDLASIYNNVYTWNIKILKEINLEFKNFIRDSLISKYKLKLIGYFDIF